MIDFWEDRILDRELRRLLKKAGGYLFEDSLEIETDATIWTPLMLAEFRSRAGYDLLPYLPVVVEAHEKYLFAFDAVTTTRVRDDFNQVLSDLYRDHHLLRAAAASRARSGWACGCSPTAWRPTPSSTPRCSTCRRRSRWASRTSTTTG